MVDKLILDWREQLSKKYDYTFFLWVTPHSKFSKAFLELLKMLQHSFTLDMTEDEFAKFRYDLLLDGLELMETTRVPHHDPETVL